MSCGKGDEAVVGPGMDEGRDSFCGRPAACLSSAGAPCNKNWRAWVWPRGRSILPPLIFAIGSAPSVAEIWLERPSFLGVRGNWELD
jgi:hypothetical protein